MPKNNSWNSQDPAQVTKGGTGLNSCSQGDLLYGSAPNTLAILPKETTPKRYLSNSGPNNNPAYSAVDIQGGVTGVLPVTNGGTGVSSSSPAFGVLAAGTGTTNPFQNIGTGSLGEVLTSNGPGVLPSFQSLGSFNSIVVQVFTSSGTYTPTAGLVHCTIEVIGGGGGGGNATNSGPGSTGTVGGGGGGGGYARKTVNSATIGVSQSVTIAAAASAATNGGTCSVGSIVSATGGLAGTNSNLNNSVVAAGGAGGVGQNGDINVHGSPGGMGLFSVAPAGSNFGFGGIGGSSIMGGGGLQVGAAQTLNVSFNGNPGQNYGGGGSGACALDNAAPVPKSGGAGATGIVIITEYLA